MSGRVMSTVRGAPAAPYTSSSAPPSPTVAHAHLLDERPSMVNFKRASITSIKELKDLANLHRKKKSKDGDNNSKTNWIDLKIESPPLVFLGPRESCVGVLFSGIVQLHTQEPATVITKWTASVSLRIKTKKPVHKGCSDCSTKVEVVRQWNLYNEARTVTEGCYTHPINHIFSGDLPATTHTSIGEIEWLFESSAETSGRPVHYQTVLQFQRALRPPGDDHCYIRTFPSSQFLVNMHLRRIVHPTGPIDIKFEIFNIVLKTRLRQSRWRVRRASWFLYETVKVAVPACPRHRNERGSSSMLNEDTREVATGKVPQAGFKYDYSAPMEPGFSEADTTEGEVGGKVIIEFPITLDEPMRLACDIDTPHGFNVTHELAIEAVVVEEATEYDTKRLDHGVARMSGLARCLRSKVPLIVTTRMGMGVSWAEEAPPTYPDVPPSPPGYVRPAEDSGVEDGGLAEQSSSSSS